MALKIRLRRMGRKKAPTYRIVIAESSMPRDGRFVANIGHYNPRTEPLVLVVDREKALYWLGKGAVPTETVQQLLKKAGVFSAEPTVLETATAAVTGTAAKAVKAVKAAAAQVVESVQEAVETITGGDDEAPAAEAQAPAAAEEQVAEEPAAEAQEPAAAEEQAPETEGEKAE